MADDRRLLKSQKNDVYQLIENAGIDARDFTWSQSDAAEYVHDRLVHAASGYWFDFGYVKTGYGEGHYARYSPGSESREMTEYTVVWSSQLEHVSAWLRNLRREIDEPNLWERLAGGEPLLEIAHLQGEDRPFEPEEIQAISQKLEEVLEYVRRELPEGSIAAITLSVENLREGLKTSGRITWVQWAIGTMISLVWGGLMAPEQARNILGLIGQAFQKLVGG